MKTKMTVLVLTLFALACNLFADEAHFIISNGDDDGQTISKAPQNSIQSFWNAVPNLGQDAIILNVGPATNSPSVAQHRVNTMAGLLGVAVPRDYNLDPAAWQWIAPVSEAYLGQGWQWFHALSTPTFNSWKGATTITNATFSSQVGHRILVNVMGTYPVSDYTITVSSSLTNIATVTFPVGTNTFNGLEIQFNPQFIGFEYGADNTNQSYYSVPNGRAVAVGDDIVLQDGQSPSTNNYRAYLRYGSTLAIYASSPTAMEEIRKQFATTNQWLKVELKKAGILVASNYVESAQAILNIVKSPDDSEFQLSISGGQENNPYSIETETDIMSASWTTFLPGNFLYSGGSPRSFPNDRLEKRFFRAVPAK